MLPTKFGVNWLLGLGEEAKNIDFQDGCNGGHLGFPIGMILAIFELQVTPMLPTKFGVNWPFGSGEEAKNRFSRWQPSWISDWHNFSQKNRFSRWLPWRPSWISNRNDFRYF